MGSQAAAAEEEEQSRGWAAARANIGDLPESCVAHVLALTSPRDACRCAAVSPCFRDAAGSDAVWARFLPPDYVLLLRRRGLSSPPSPACVSKKETYLGLADSAAVLVEDGGGMAVWLAKGSGGKCVALSARRLCLPWDDGELCWRWTPHLLSRFSEVAQLVDCTCLDIYARLPSATWLTPATAYVAYLVFATVDGHRGLSFPDQETTVSVGDRITSHHTVCLRPDVLEAHRFTIGLKGGGGSDDGVRVPTLRSDGWWEMEMGRLRTEAVGREEEEVVASFEVLGWYPKCGLVVEGVEFRPLCL